MPRAVLSFALLLSLLLAGCRDAAGSLVISSIPAAESITMTDSAVAAFGLDVAAVAPSTRIQTMPDEAGALDAVRSRAATVALVRSTATQLDSLELTEVESRPVALLVPFTFPVEGISATQARDLAAGSVKNWSELGGPALAAEPLVTTSDAVSDVLGAVPLAAVTDAGAALAERRGRVVIAPWAPAGPLVKALRIDGLRPDEAGYPLAMRWVVAGRSGEPQAAALGRALAARRGPEGTEIVLDAVGDIMLGRDVGRQIAARGPRFPLEAVTPLLAGSDLRIANLELPLTERGQAARKDYVFRAPPSSVEALTAGGLTAVTLANNHMLDYGQEGLLDTLTTLDRAGVVHVGAGRNATEARTPAILAVKGLRIALLGYVNTPNDGRSGWVARSSEAGPSSPGVAWGEADAIRRDVAAARSQADIVIVALHAGWEYTNTPNPTQRELAYAAVEAGASLVLGAHPHVLQGIEVYRSVPIVYSLGNFVFDLDDDDRRVPGLPSILTGVLRVRLGRDGVHGLELRPAQIDQRDVRPVPVTGAAARPVYERLYSLTDALNPSASGGRVLQSAGGR